MELPDDVPIQSAEGQDMLRNLHLCFAGADVKDCFHGFLIPTWLSAYFALPEISAGTLGLVGTDDPPFSRASAGIR